MSKNERCYASTPQYASMVWCSVKAQGQLYLYLLPQLLWDPKAQYRVHKNSSLDPIMSHFNSINIITPCFLDIYFDIILYLCLDFPTKTLYALLISPKLATCADQIEVFWAVRPCGVVAGYQCFRHAYCPIFTSPCRWRQHGPLKCWFPATTPHGVTTQKTSTLIHHRRKSLWTRMYRSS